MADHTGFACWQRKLEAASVPFIIQGTQSTEEVRWASQAIKESVSRKTIKTKTETAVVSNTSSFCIIFADPTCKYFGGRIIGRGHIFLLLGIKEYDVGQYCGMSSGCLPSIDAAFSSCSVNKFH